MIIHSFNETKAAEDVIYQVYRSISLTVEEKERVGLRRVSPYYKQKYFLNGWIILLELR